MMKISIFRILLLCLFVAISVQLISQRSIKYEKQRTNFFYTQLNLHGGFVSDINGNRFDVPNRGPDNQIVFQWVNKNKKNLQKGYIKNIGFKGFKLRSGVSFNKAVNRNGVWIAGLKLNFYDTFLNFGTRWDNTNFQLGLKSIPFGHNPKLDPASSFMTNLIKLDLGLVQDLGIFIETPISKMLDLEFSLTSGGVLNKPFVVCDNLIDYSGTEEVNTTISLGEFNYEGTWLMTGRIGSPSFKKNELGLVFTSGNLHNTNVRNDMVNIIRIGGDWVHKYREYFKLSSLLSFGKSISDDEGEFNSTNLQMTLDIFMKRKFIVSCSFARNDLKHTEFDELFYDNYTTAFSLSYALTPHTRLRLNSYYTGIQKDTEIQKGTFLQLSTGIGKR